MTAITDSVAAMPNSSMWWPIILSGLWSFYMVWPRLDGGGVPYGGYANMLPWWASLGPIIFFWVAWAGAVAIAGAMA
jgi:hypothetical protein